MEQSDDDTGVVFFLRMTGITGFSKKYRARINNNHTKTESHVIFFTI